MQLAGASIIIVMAAEADSDVDAAQLIAKELNEEVYAEDFIYLLEDELMCS